MKGCKAWQIIFGIICMFMTIALGAVTVVLFMPYLGGELSAGIFSTISNSIGTIAKTVGIDGYSLTVLGVVFLLPTILLLLATNLLLYGKRGGSVVAGSILALVALVIVGGVTGWFSKTMFGSHQKLYLLILGGGSVIFLLVFIATTSAVKRARRNAKAVEIADDTDEIVITVEEDGDEVADSTQDTDDDVLFMAQDYGSVSEVADTTYEHNDVLPKKVLEKLKIARELYEKGAITKDEYLSIVNKYLTQQ